MQRTAVHRWDWVSGGLLVAMLQIAAARLVTTNWAPLLYWTETMAGFGTVLGIALGLSRFRRGAVIALAAGYTATVVPWQLTMSSTEDALLDRLGGVGAVLAVSFHQFIQRQPVKDSLFFLLFVCLAFWLIGLIAGYWLFRHGRVLGSIVVGGIAILVVQAYGNYQPQGSWWVAAYALLAILLAGRVHFLGQKQQWTNRRVFVSEDSGTNIMIGLFMTTALAILVAWWIPAAPSSIQRAADSWDSYFRPMRDRLSHAVTSLSGPYGKPGNNFYGSSLLLGRSAATGDSTVLTIEVVKSPNLNLRYYWRGRVYNNYQAGVWSASTDSRLPFTPQQEELGIPDSADRSEAEFQVTSHFPTQNLIYGPSPAVWLDRAADVSALRTEPGVYDTFAWETRTLLASGSSYQVRAQLRNPTVQELRAAGVGYPAWVAEKFLDLPEKYRNELTQLAQEITVAAETPYDKSAAITNYLRSTIKYSLRVPAAPEGQDPVIWVLLHHKQGFCNYSASAEVLLLRAIGIPARLAVGFARGDLENGTYTVYRRNAHAWPEVYFPNIGWVEFEPTASEDPLVRPSTVLQSARAPLDQLIRSRDEQESRIPREVEIAPPAAPLPFALTPLGRGLATAVWVVVGLLVVLLTYRFGLLRRVPILLSRALETGGGPAPTWVRRWVRWNGLHPAERAFASVNWSLRLLGKPQPLQATPALRAEALSRLLPTSARQIRVLREELETALYTPRTANLHRARWAALVILLHSVRTRLSRMAAALDGRAVYSETEP